MTRDSATVPRAFRQRVDIPVKGPLTDVPWITTTRKSDAVRRPAPRLSWPRRLPRRAHPHPRAGGRGDGPRVGRRNGRLASGCPKRQLPHLLARGLLKGLLLAARQPGLVLLRQLRNPRSRRSAFLLDWRGGYRRFVDGRRRILLFLLLAFLCHIWVEPTSPQVYSNQHCVFLSTGLATELASGIARREARYGTQPGHPEGIARHNSATGLRAGRRRPSEVAARRRSWMAACSQHGVASADRRAPIMEAGALPPPRIPFRTPALAATDKAMGA